TDYVTYKFVTCAGVRNKLNFELYLSPYDVYSWICILATFLFLIPIFLILLLAFGKSASLSRIYNSFGTMFVLIEIGVEDSETQSGKQRLVLGSALLLGLVLTNAYKGIFVSDLIAPAPSTSVYENFENLSQFVILLMGFNIKDEIITSLSPTKDQRD